MKFLKYLLPLLILLVTELQESNCEEDLYAVLKVSRTATQKEIKRSYKQLAREFHPDKTDDPDATTKFTKINEAYETLGDIEKRREYDNFGYTAGTARQERGPRGGGFHGFNNFNGFDSFFHTAFNDHGGQESIIDKHLITMRQYITTVFPNSFKKPCILYFFTDFCFNCMRIEHHIEKYFQELNSVGVCAAAVHASRSSDLSSHIRVISVPSIVGVISERHTFFGGSVSSQSLRDFTRNLFPHNIITKLNDQTMLPFLEGWVDNRVRGILFSGKEEFPVRFLAAAFYYKSNVAVGHVNTHSSECKETIRKYNINRNRETLLIFNEDFMSPVATISMLKLSRSTLDEVIEGNKHLALPRLSSQAFLEELCPEEFRVKQRKLCVVLLTKKAEKHDMYRDDFRRFSQDSPYNGNSRVQFAYMYADTQKDFVQALSGGKHVEETEQLPIAILWRVEKYQLKYEWLETGWQKDTQSLSGEALNRRLNVLLGTDTVMPYKITPPTLYNEHGLSLITRIGYKLLHWGERIKNYFYRYDSSTYITLALTVMFIGGMSYFMVKLSKLEEIQVQNLQPQKTQPRPPSRTFDEKSLKMYELDYRSYKQLVTEADTGLTIMLLVDKDSKDSLVKEFAKIVNPYSRYSALTFGFMQLEYNIKWYKTLLEESIEDVQLENINIRNCVGTVLAINGYRKYFYIYSAKRARKFIRQRNNVTTALGFDELDEKSDDEGAKPAEYFYLDEVLDGLAMWMDKIFDGTIRKIRLNNWPEMNDGIS